MLSTVLLFTSNEGSAGWLAGTVAGYGLWFALGMGLALISVALDGRESSPPAAIRLIRRAPLLPWALALAVYVAFSLAVPPTPFLLLESDRLLAHLAFAAIALLAMLPAVFCERGEGAPARLLGSPAAAWLGLISYGIFLWHYAIAMLLGDDLGFLPLLAATLAATIACAAASYYLLERPVLRLKNPARLHGLGLAARAPGDGRP